MYKQSIQQLSAGYKTQADYNVAVQIINKFMQGLLAGGIMFGIPLVAVLFKSGAI